MSWVFLATAGLLEIAFTVALRQTDGFTRLWPSVLAVSLAALSLYCVTRSTETIPLGTAYAIWAGVGAVGTILIGVAAFDEPVTLMRAVFLTLLVGSVIGLKTISA